MSTEEQASRIRPYSHQGFVASSAQDKAPSQQDPAFPKLAGFLNMLLASSQFDVVETKISKAKYDTLGPRERSYTLGLDSNTYYQKTYLTWPDLPAPRQRNELRRSGIRTVGVIGGVISAALLWGNTGTAVPTTEVDQTAVGFARSHYHDLNLLEKYQETYVAGPVFYYGPERKGASMLGGWVAKQIQGNRDYRFGDECLASSPYDTKNGGASWHVIGKDLTIFPANSGGAPLEFKEDPHGMLRPTQATADTLAQKKCNETMSVWHTYQKGVVSHFDLIGSIE